MPEDTHTLFWKRDIELPMDQTDPHAISCPIRIDRTQASIAVNADGICDDAFLSVELLDEMCRPIDGLSGTGAASIREPGLRQMAIWSDSETLDLAGQTIRIKVTWQGKRSDDAHLYALYVDES